MRNRISKDLDPVRVTEHGAKCWLRSALEPLPPARRWIAYGLESYEDVDGTAHVGAWAVRVVPTADRSLVTVANPTGTDRLLLGIMGETGQDVLVAEAAIRPFAARSWRISNA